MKFNPFRPNGITAPGMFQGRISEIDNAEQCLFQAKNENPVHFLIQGERGIGKSSLFFIIEAIAKGKIPTRTGVKLNFLVVSLDLGDSNTALDIVRTISREIKTTINEHEYLKTKAKEFWNWITNWEVLGVKYNKEAESFDPQDAAHQLINQIAELQKSLKNDIDGILILIDEADRPGEEADLGLLMKLFTERMVRKGCNTIVFGVAGLPGLVTQLRASHESSPRVFSTMLLEPLLSDERREVIRAGLRDSNAKNTRAVSIDDDAMNLLANLSEGYPHFIQQFAYCAFEADSDDRISMEDVIDGAFKENGAISQLGDKYFNEMYNYRISSDNYRKVLDTMAKHSDDWVARKTLIEESGLPKTIVTNALNALKAKEIILSDDSRKGQGYYRLPTRSFAVWINVIKSISERSGRTINA